MFQVGQEIADLAFGPSPACAFSHVPHFHLESPLTPSPLACLPCPFPVGKDVFDLTLQPRMLPVICNIFLLGTSNPVIPTSFHTCPPMLPPPSLPVGKEIVDLALDRIRKLADNCTGLQVR